MKSSAETVVTAVTGGAGAAVTEADVEAGARAILVANGMPQADVDRWWPYDIAHYREMLAGRPAYADARSRVTDAMRASRAALSARPPHPLDDALRDVLAKVERLQVAERDALAMVLFVGLCGGDRATADERALAEARAVIAPFASYAEQKPYLDNAEGEIGEFYGQAFRVSISYRALRAARDFARKQAAAQLGTGPASGEGWDDREGGQRHGK